MKMNNKKGMISLEALIILIAMIVIAALSAGIIIRNSGLLGQRAVTVSEQSRERLVTGINVISMTGDANISAEKINDLEMLVRLKAGSLPIQLKNLKLLFTTQDVAMSASLQDLAVNDKYADINISTINTTWQSIADIEDTDLQVEAVEYIRYNSTTLNVEFNLSFFSNNADPDDEDAIVPGVATIAISNLSNASGTPVALNIVDEAIILNGVKYGYINIIGNATVNNSLSGINDAVLSNFPISDVACKYVNLIEERRFCMKNKIGNGDSTLETGEIVALRFRFKPYNVLPIETQYELQMLPKEGAIETLSAITPSTLVVEKTKLWG